MVNVVLTTAKDLATVRIRLVHHAKVANVVLTTAKDLATVHIRLVHHAKVANVVLTAAKDLATVRIRLVHRAKVAKVVLTTVRDLAIVHIHLVKTGKHLVHPLKELEEILRRVQHVMKHLVILRLGRIVNLRHAKMIVIVQRGFRNVIHLKVVIGMIRHLPFLPHIN
jgi:hypothetical protein